jgi:hypothetical protein
LVLENYYPFEGKAFAEDLFHSHILRSRGIKLSRCGTAHCNVDFTSNKIFKAKSSFGSYFGYSVALKAFAKHSNGNTLFSYFYLFIFLIFKTWEKFISRSNAV